MARRPKSSITGDEVFKEPPIPTVEGRESQLIALAVDLAEQQLRDGTASAQVITHFLKLGTTVARLEKEKLAHENELLQAKTEAIESQRNVEALYAEALAAMKSYSGTEEDDTYDEYQDV